MDSLVLTVHKTILIVRLAYVQNTLQPSFVVSPRHLFTMSVPISGPDLHYYANRNVFKISSTKDYIDKI